MYEFEHRLKTISGYAHVPKSDWERLDAGSAVPVTFIESAPEISAPIRRADMTTPAMLGRVFDFEIFVMLGFFLVVTSAMVIFARALTTANLRLMHSGAATIATVTRVKGIGFSCSYDVGNGTFKREFLFRSASVPRPAVGDRFVILYDEERARRSVPWTIARSQFEAANEVAVPIDSVDQPLPPPVVSGAPAAVRLSWQLPLMFVVFVLFSAPFIVRYKASSDVRVRVARVRKTAREVEGTVVSAVPIRSRHLERLSVRYRYVVNGNAYEQTYAESTLRHRERFTPGATIVITYAADAPQISVPLSKRELDAAAMTARMDIGLAIVVMMIIVGFLIWVAWRTGVEWNFARNGHVAIAVVKSVDGSLFRRMRYRFMTTHGDLEQTARLQSKSFRPGIGERIEVLYLDHPVRSMPAADLVFVKRVA